MTKQHWIGVAAMAAVAVVGGAIFDVVAVAGTAVISLAGAHAKKKVR